MAKSGYFSAKAKKLDELFHDTLKDEKDPGSAAEKWQRRRTTRNWPRRLRSVFEEIDARPRGQKALAAFYLVERDGGGVYNCDNNRHQSRHRLERPRALD
jgi:hypothetical protein